MTDSTRFLSRSRDIQDLAERGVWGQREDVPGAGSIMSVRGTGTEDLELPIMNFGYSFNLSQNANAEVIMVSLSSDPNEKVALPTLPRDVQYQWGEGTGGIQHPMDPDRRLEYNGDETWLKDGNFKLGHDKQVEVIIDGGNITINVAGETAVNIDGAARIESSGDMELAAPNVDIQSGRLTHNGVDIGDSHVHGGVTPGGGFTLFPRR